MDKTKPLIINGYEYKNYRTLDLSTPEDFCIGIIKVNNDNEIARTKRVKRDSIVSDINEKETNYFLLISCFELIKCPRCSHMYSAVRMSKTASGCACMDCINRNYPINEFKPLDIERYVNACSNT